MVGKQLQSINFMLFLKNPIFLRKFPLIKLQMYWQTGQANSSKSSNYHSMAALFRAFLTLSNSSNPRSKSAVNVVRTRSLKKSSGNQRFLRPVAERFASVSEDELCERCIIKQLLNSDFAWHHQLSKPCVCVICLSLRLRQIRPTLGA